MFLEVCNFADDKTIYDCGEDLCNILEILKHDMKILLKWFRINYLQANPGSISIRDFREEKTKFSQINNEHNRS